MEVSPSFTTSRAEARRPQALDLDAVDAVARRQIGLGVVNYQGFYLATPVVDAYAALVRELEDRYYTEVSRYTTSAFMRLKLGRTLARHVAPHIFESYEDAQAFHTRRGERA